MCINLLQSGPVGEGSDHLQQIKLWPSCAPGKWVCGVAEIFGSTLLQSSRSVCVSLSAFLSVLWHYWLGNRKGIWPVKSWVLVCCWRWFDQSFALLIAPAVTTISIVHSTTTPSLRSSMPLLRVAWTTVLSIGRHTEENDGQVTAGPQRCSVSDLEHSQVWQRSDAHSA